MPHILKVDSSARHDNSKSRPLTEQIAQKLVGGGSITARDVAESVPPRHRTLDAGCLHGS